MARGKSHLTNRPSRARQSRAKPCNLKNKGKIKAEKTEENKMTKAREFEINEIMINLYQTIKQAHNMHPYMTPCTEEVKNEIEQAFNLMFSPSEVAEMGFNIW